MEPLCKGSIDNQQAAEFLGICERQIIRLKKKYSVQIKERHREKVDFYSVTVALYGQFNGLFTPDLYVNFLNGADFCSYLIDCYFPTVWTKIPSVCYLTEGISKRLS